MLVVISYPTAVANEAAIFNALFDEGLEVLHIRKPGIAMDEITLLLEKIKPPYRQLVAVHQHHERSGDLGINRLHFTEARRKELSAEKLIWMKETNTILSTSIHQTQDYKELSPCFDYTFFGPV